MASVARIAWPSSGVSVLSRLRRLTWRPADRAGGYRSFDPVSLGTLEAQVWVAYYRRDWLTFIRAGAVCARENFGLSWPETLACSWLVMRANQRWAPFPDNDADGARRAMAQCYRILARRYGQPRDPERAAALDVNWWRVHREFQHDLGASETALRDAIASFWAEIYDVPAPQLLEAAARRTSAMGLSDRWVAAGCPADSPLTAAARATLVSSYEALLDVVAA
jgi:hypothetical protein